MKTLTIDEAVSNLPGWLTKALAGEEIGRMNSWGTHPMAKAEHLMSSPTMMNDLPQTFMEPLLFKTACSRGTQSRMSTEYQSHVQDCSVKWDFDFFPDSKNHWKIGAAAAARQFVPGVKRWKDWSAWTRVS